MTRRQLVRYEMLRRVRDFGTIYEGRFPDTSVGGQAFAVIRGVVDDMSGQAMVRMAALQEGTRAREEARRVLRQQLQAIARTAKIIARTAPGFDDGFRMPDRTNDQVLTTAGRLFANGAEPLAAQFIAYGLPDTFVATLRAQVTLLEASIAAYEDGNRDRAGADAQTEAALQIGRDAVTRLDLIVANQFRGDVTALAQWRRDRLTRAAYRKAPPAEPATGTASPNPEATRTTEDDAIASATAAADTQAVLS